MQTGTFTQASEQGCAQQGVAMSPLPVSPSLSPVPSLALQALAGPTLGWAPRGQAHSGGHRGRWAWRGCLCVSGRGVRTAEEPRPAERLLCRQRATRLLIARAKGVTLPGPVCQISKGTGCPSEPGRPAWGLSWQERPCDLNPRVLYRMDVGPVQ